MATNPFQALATPQDDPNQPPRQPQQGQPGMFESFMGGPSQVGSGGTRDNIYGAMTGGGTLTPGINPGTPDPEKPEPTPGINPGTPDQQGINQFQTWAQGQFGRQATPQELQQIAGQIGYSGGALTPEMMTAAQGAATNMAKAQGWSPNGAGASAGPAPATPAEVQQSLQDRLRSMLGTQTGDVNMNSQEFQSQRNAFNRGQGSALERAKIAAAERAGGANTGGLEAQMQGIDLAGAQAAGDFEANLAGTQVERQRQDVQQALQAALQQRGMDQQNTLGQGDLALRRLLGMGQLDLGRAQLSQQGQQFNDQLGFNYWDRLQNYQNQQVRTLLGQ